MPKDLMSSFFGSALNRDQEVTEGMWSSAMFKTKKKKASRKRQFNAVTSTLHDNFFAIVFSLIRVLVFVIAGDVKFPAAVKLKLTHLQSNDLKC